MEGGQIGILRSIIIGMDERYLSKFLQEVWDLANTCYFLLFLNITILVHIEQNLIVVLICFSTMTNVRNLFLCFIGHLCILFGEMSIEGLFPSFYGLVFCWSVVGLTYILWILNTYQIQFTIFFHCIGCHFYFSFYF